MDSAAAERVYMPAALEALSEFSIAADRPSLVALSENVTFRVRDQRDGAHYVLRLHRPGYHDIDELNSELVWVRALADAGIAVPPPIQAADGRDYVRVRVPGTGEDRYAGLTRWVDGEIVAEVLGHADGRVVEQHFARLGSIMAAMHNQASAWSPPESFRRHRLDADGLLGDQPFWGRFWEHEGLTVDERRALLATRDRIHALLDRYGHDPATFSMIHADLHLDNLVVDGERLTVIDFDDAGFGWHQYDIAVALYHSPSRCDPAAVERAFLDGYRSVRSITADAAALIPVFLLVRGMAIIGWKNQRPEVAWPDEMFEQIKAGVMAGCEMFVPPSWG